MTLFDDALRNRNSEQVKDALTRYCRICGAEAGQLCHNVGELSGLKNKLVHYSRVRP